MSNADSLYADTSFNQTNSPNKEHYTTPESHIPIEPTWYNGKTASAATDIPGPIFGAKASPENYKLFTKGQYFRGDFIRDGYFHTGPADLSAMKKNSVPDAGQHLDKMGISWMDGNVSEWMKESYAENWTPFFEKHLAVLDADTSESAGIAKQIEMLYDKGNAKNGRLVRGANWYDERFSGRPSAERNDAGINPKRFVDPSEQHSTIGFRYVIHVKRK